MIVCGVVHAVFPSKLIKKNTWWTHSPRACAPNVHAVAVTHSSALALQRITLYFFRLIISLFAGCWSAGTHVHSHGEPCCGREPQENSRVLGVCGKRRVSLIVNRWTKHSYISRGTVQTSVPQSLFATYRKRTLAFELVLVGAQAKSSVQTAHVPVSVYNFSGFDLAKSMASTRFPVHWLKKLERNICRGKEKRRQKGT